MPTSLIIVDDFLDNAQELRAAGLSLQYPAVQANYPGRNSTQAVSLSGLDQEISRLVGEPLVPAPGQAHCKFRLTLASDVGQAKVHVDPSHWTGILYLSQPQHCRGGTEFYRHLQTNTDRGAYNDAEAQAMGYPSAKQMMAKVLEDTNDDSRWEMTMRVPMRFNRLVLLRPWLWHAAGENFGSTPEDGRLIYLMFYASAR